MDLLIAPQSLKNSTPPDLTLTTRRIPKTRFYAAPVFQAANNSPWSGLIRLPTPIPISRSCTVQLVIRDAAGLVGKVFLVKLGLEEMPMNSEALIRQKHYHYNSLDDKRHMQHGVQLRVLHNVQRLPSIPQFDRHGQPVERTHHVIEQIALYGIIRIIFSFNQAATLGPTSSRDTSIMQEQLQIVTLPPTYFPLHVDKGDEQQRFL